MVQEITGSGVNVTLTYDSSNYRAKYLISDLRPQIKATMQ